MRRRALAAIVGSLVLAACSDQSQQSPTEPKKEPGPSFIVALPFDCSTSPWVLGSLPAIFPGGKGKTLLSSAQEKINAIIKACQGGKLKDAQAKAMFFDDWMFKKFQSKLLTTNPTLNTDVGTLFIDVLNGVGLNTSTVSPDFVTSDAGTGVYTGDDIEVTSALGFARLQVPAGGFGDEETLLIIDKLPNNTELRTPPGQVREQFPPFYDFDAINASNNHVLESGFSAHVEMCLYNDIVYPPGIGIGHNPVFGAPGYPFEILEPAGTTLGCGVEELGSFNPGGLQGMATSAWLAAKRGMTALFLPQPLRAATLVVGGSIAGKAGSLSPFGVVDGTAFEFTQTGDPTGQTFTENFTLEWSFCTKGCFTVYPEVRVINADGSGISGVPVTVTLDPVGNSPGTFQTGEGESTTSVFTDSETGTALFDDLQITAPGTYRLRFSIPGRVGSLVSGEFTVIEITEE